MDRGEDGEERSEEGARGVLVAEIDDPIIHLACETEREFIRALGADCHTPVGCLCEVDATVLRLRAMVCSPDGKLLLRDERESPIEDSISLARQAAQDMLACGARGIMEQARTSSAKGKSNP